MKKTKAQELFESRFDAFSSHYEETAFDASPALAEISRLEVEAVLRRLPPSSVSRVLEIGIGTGRFARHYAAAGATVVGLEPTLGMLAKSGENVPGVELVQGRLGDPLPFRDDVFDAALSIRVLKYVEDLDFGLREVARVVRPGGRVVLEFTNSASVARLGYGSEPITFLQPGQAAATFDRAGMTLKALDGGSRLPFPVHKRAPQAIAAERWLRKGLGATFLARSFIATATVDA